MAQQDQIDQRSPARDIPAAGTRPASEVADNQGHPVVPEQRGQLRPPAELVVSRGPESGARYAVTHPGISIGRERGADIVLDDPSVSRTHAELAVRDGGFVISDSGSLNGTYINRKPVDVSELADGDEVWIGKIRFVFQIAG